LPQEPTGIASGRGRAPGPAASRHNQSLTRRTTIDKRPDLKTTSYFEAIRSRPDRATITDEWILQVMDEPEAEVIQEDGRIRRWARIPEAEGRYLRVVLLADGETVHNVFFDRRFKP
jgi:hypothetical protein